MQALQSKQSAVARPHARQACPVHRQVASLVLRPSRVNHVARAAAAPPSSATAANELQSLMRLSTVVPDTMAFDSLTPGAKLAAATVSAATLRSVLLGESLGLKPYENAINAALAAGKGGSAGSALAASSDPVDRALVNVGAMLVDVVWGRVATDLDPYLAHDEAGIVAKVKSLASLYGALRVPRDRLVFSIPATWEGVQAAGKLEAEGIATEVYMVYGLTQGVAAMQAGASVVQINVGRLRDWYAAHPGVIKNPNGPREDVGLVNTYDPALELVKELYAYSRRYHPKTKIMATGLRTRQDALDLAGLDYLVLPGRVMSALAGVATDQGYNDGLSAVAGPQGLEAALSAAAAAEAEVAQMAAVTADAWQRGLDLAAGVAGELLETSLKLRRSDEDALKKLLAERISTMT